MTSSGQDRWLAGPPLSIGTQSRPAWVFPLQTRQTNKPVRQSPFDAGERPVRHDDVKGSFQLSAGSQLGHFAQGFLLLAQWEREGKSLRFIMGLSKLPPSGPPCRVLSGNRRARPRAAVAVRPCREPLWCLISPPPTKTHLIAPTFSLIIQKGKQTKQTSKHVNGRRRRHSITRKPFRSFPLKEEKKGGKRNVKESSLREEKGSEP